jgi:hypothetical protein
LRNLINLDDKDYWDIALPNLREILNGLTFDRADFNDLLIGRSVTEWEVKSAFQDKDSNGVIIPLSKSLQKRAIWSHRQFRNGVKDEEDMKNDFSDVKKDYIKEGYLKDLKSWMTSTFFPPDQNIKEYSDDCPELTVKNLSIEGLDLIGEKYMNAFKGFVRSRLKSSLGEVNAQQQAWLKVSTEVVHQRCFITVTLHIRNVVISMADKSLSKKLSIK